MPARKYRAAVIGCGHRGVNHIDAYGQIDNAEIVACCAPTPTRREPVAERFGIRAYGDAAEMIRTEKPDIVHVVTWPDVRVDPMTLVSELGVPLCTVEKPIAIGVVDWRKLCELAVSSKTKFAVCHQTRWNPNLEKCRQALRSGKLGRVLFLDFSAGMNVSGQGTHTLNYGLSLNDDSPITHVFGAAAGDKEMASRHPSPDATSGSLTCENGVRAMWVSGPPAPRCGNPETVHEHVRAAAYCENGRVEWQQFGKWEIVGPGGTEGGLCREDPEQFAANWLFEQAEFHRAMFTWLEDDTRPAGTNLARSLHEWKIVLALYASAVRREPIALADFDPPDDLFTQLAEVLKS